MAVSIRADGLSKQYQLGSLGARYDTLREHVMRTLRGGAKPARREKIWALDDVSFEIREGEAVGIIGRNGAGKTTLLKLLSRVTAPTRGRIALYGRVGSLLEVGTGFHPELTGRENVLLNGAILGMRRSEVRARFDEIVEFSGISRFIDTPVKRYSSGMYVRLAFSVAAHLDTEILLVDEVLAVGDADFQRRSLGKMESIGRTGRTVVFVSHAMPMIARLCDRALLLDGGRLVAEGPTERVIARYLAGAYGAGSVEWSDADAPGKDHVRLRAVRVVGSNGAASDSVDVREQVGIELVFDVVGEGPRFVPWIVLYDDRGTHVFSAFDTDPAWRVPREPGRYVSTAWIPPNLLNEGTHLVSVSLHTFTSGKAVVHARADEAVAFQVVDPGEGDTARGDYHGAWPGPVRPLLRWTSQHAGHPAAASGSAVARS